MDIKIICLSGILLAAFFPARAQQNSIIPVDDPACHYISNLQHHGYLLNLNATSLPYTQKEVMNSLRQVDRQTLTVTERNWYNKLKSFFKESEDLSDFDYGLDLKGGSYIENSRRENTLRPLDNKLFVYPLASLDGFAEHGDFIAHFGLQHSLYYDRDPDGLDAANRLYVRSENAYIGYNSSWLKVYFGRYQNQWAPYGEASTILSSNPRSFDQVDIRMGSDKFSWRAVFGELDNISQDSIFTGQGFEPGAKRRHIVAHRFDWRPNHHINIALFESVLYSGTNSGFSFKYFNPLHIYSFVSDNAPKNDENNLMVGGMVWLQWQGITFNSQFMLDDLQIEKSKERNNYAISSSLYKANVLRDIDLGLEFEAVSHQAYVAHQPEGRYVYLKRGLATQFNDYIRSAVYTRIFPVTWLSLKPEIQFLWQGEQSINQLEIQTYPDGRPLEYILTGMAERTIRPSLSFRYQPVTSFWIEGDAGVNFMQNYQNQPGINKSRFAGMLRFGFDFPLIQ